MTNYLENLIKSLCYLIKYNIWANLVHCNYRRFLLVKYFLCNIKLISIHGISHQVDCRSLKKNFSILPYVKAEKT